jgi:hypothetical protein
MLFRPVIKSSKPGRFEFLHEFVQPSGLSRREEVLDRHLRRLGQVVTGGARTGPLVRGGEAGFDASEGWVG